MSRLLVVAGVLGASAVGLGAYGAHGLEERVAGLGHDGAEVAKRVDTFVTGSRYQLATAVAVLAIGLLRERSRWLGAAAWLLIAGVLIFSGLLYALAFVGDGWRWLGAVVPLGGLTMIIGWALIAVAGFSKNPRPPEDAGAPTTKDEHLASELIRLEEVITHQQRLVNDLNEALTETRRDVDAAAPRLHALDQTVKRLAEHQQGAEDHPDERPPHY